MDKKTILNAKINQKYLDEIKKVYKADFPDLVNKLLSINDEPIFFKKCRLMSHIEILSTEDLYDTDFSAMNMIPLFDCHENNFIVFNYKKNKYEIYNIVDCVSFDENLNIESYLAS